MWRPILRPAAVVINRVARPRAGPVTQRTAPARRAARISTSRGCGVRHFDGPERLTGSGMRHDAGGMPATPVPSSRTQEAVRTMVQTGVHAPGRAAIAARTLRRDRWWLQPAITFGVLMSFIVYSTIRAFQNDYYYSRPYISPFYSPCLADRCVDGSRDLGTPVGHWWSLSPALLILVVPLGFRLTCYYYRKAYYRSFWLSP